MRAEDTSRDVSELLADWKRDQRELLRRFDANQDGKIDLEEWEAVRRAALEHVHAEQVERSVQPDLHVLARAGDRRPFILSTRAEAVLSRDYRRAGGASIFAGIAAVGAGIFALLARGLLP
ncbi:MAG TPA: EF-hand domain-containing protein [Nevskiaceae bacterium]|nr:EF-hand domain-containing protein [Nevskiaceae bacterium]